VIDTLVLRDPVPELAELPVGETFGRTNRFRLSAGGI
jgi:hypothetical protein